MRLSKDLRRKASLGVVFLVALSLTMAVALTRSLPAHAEAPGTPIESGPEIPSVDSATGLGNKLSADPNSRVSVAAQNAGSNSALVRISVYNSESDNVIYAGGAPVFDIATRQSISQTVLVPLESNTANIYANTPTDVRIELLAAFQGNDQLPGSFRATAPELRVDSSTGLGVAGLSSQPQSINVTGKGSIPAQNVRAVFISGTFQASEPTVLHIGDISLKVAGYFALSTVVVPDEKGTVSLWLDSGTAGSKIWTRGYAVGSKMGDNSANLGGSFVPKSEQILSGERIGEEKQTLSINAQSDTAFSLILASASHGEGDELTTLDIGSEHQEREQGAAVDKELGGLPQLLVAHPGASGEVNAVVHQGSAEVEAWHIGDFLAQDTPGGISLEKAPDIRIETPAARENYSFKDHGGVTISGTVQTGSLSLSRVEVSALASSVDGQATRGGQPIPELTANEQPAVQDDGSQTRVVIGNAEIRYLPDGQAHFEIFTAPPRDDDWTFEVVAYTRADTFKQASVTAHIELPTNDDVVISKNAYSIGNPNAPEGRNFNLRVIRLEEKAILFERTEELSPGMILTAGIMENAPSGFIRKVIAVDQTPDGTMATTDAALISDAILQVNYVDRTNVINYATPEDIQNYQDQLSAIDGLENVEVYKEDVCQGSNGFENAEGDLGKPNDVYEQTVDESGTVVHTKKNGEEVSAEQQLVYAGDKPPEEMLNDMKDGEGEDAGLKYDYKNNPGWDENKKTEQFTPSCGKTEDYTPIEEKNTIVGIKTLAETGGNQDIEKTDQGVVVHFCIAINVGTTFADFVKAPGGSMQIEGGFNLCRTVREQQYKDSWLKVDLDLRWDFWNMRPWAEIGTATTKVSEQIDEWTIFAFARLRLVLGEFSKGFAVGPINPQPRPPDEHLQLFKWKWSILIGFVPVIFGFSIWMVLRLEVDLDVIGGVKKTTLKTTRSGWALNTRTGKRDIAEDGNSKSSEVQFTGARIRLRASLRFVIGVDFTIYDVFTIGIAAGILFSASISIIWHRSLGTKAFVISGEFKIDLTVFIIAFINVHVPVLGKPQFYLEHQWNLYTATLAQATLGSPNYRSLPGRADFTAQQGAVSSRRVLPNQLYALVKEGVDPEDHPAYDPVPISDTSDGLPLKCIQSDRGWSNVAYSIDDADCINFDGYPITSDPAFSSDVTTGAATVGELFCGGSLLDIGAGYASGTPDPKWGEKCVEQRAANFALSYILGHRYSIFDKIPSTTGRGFGVVQTDVGGVQKRLMPNLGPLVHPPGPGTPIEDYYMVDGNKTKLKELSVAYSEQLKEVPFEVLDAAERNFENCDKIDTDCQKAKEFIALNKAARDEIPNRVKELIDDWKCTEYPKTEEIVSISGNNSTTVTVTKEECRSAWNSILQAMGYTQDLIASITEDTFKRDVAPKFGLVPAENLRPNLLQSDENGKIEIYFLPPGDYSLVPIGEDRAPPVGQPARPASYSYEKTPVQDFNIAEWTEGSYGGNSANHGNKWETHPEHLSASLPLLGSAAVRLVHKSRNVTRNEYFREVTDNAPILYKDGDVIEYQDALEYPKYLCADGSSAKYQPSTGQTPTCLDSFPNSIYENQQMLQNVKINTAIAGKWTAEDGTSSAIPISKTLTQINAPDQADSNSSFNTGTSSFSSTVGAPAGSSGIFEIAPGTTFTQTYRVKMVGDREVTTHTDAATLNFDHKAEIVALNNNFTTAFNQFGSSSKAVASELKFKSRGLNISPDRPTVGMSYKIFDHNGNLVQFSNNVEDRWSAYSAQYTTTTDGERALVTPANGVLDIAYLPPGEYTIKQYKAPPIWTVDENFSESFIIKPDGSYILHPDILIDYKINLDTDVSVENLTRESEEGVRSYTTGDGAMPVKAGDHLRYKVSASMPSFKDGTLVNIGPVYNPRLVLDFDSNNLEISTNSLSEITDCQRLFWKAGTGSDISDENRLAEFDYAAKGIQQDSENFYYENENDDFINRYENVRTLDQYAQHYEVQGPGGCNSHNVLTPYVQGYSYAGFILGSDSAFQRLGYGVDRSSLAEVHADLGRDHIQSPFEDSATQNYMSYEENHVPVSSKITPLLEEGITKWRPTRDSCGALSFFINFNLPDDGKPCTQVEIPYSVSGAMVPDETKEFEFEFVAKADFDNSFITSTILNHRTMGDIRPVSSPQRIDLYNGEYSVKSVEQDSMPNKLVPGAEYELVSAYVSSTGIQEPIYLSDSPNAYAPYSEQLIDVLDGDHNDPFKASYLGKNPPPHSNHLRADENGTVDLHYLDKGNYELRRISTPPGYREEAPPIAIKAGYNDAPHNLVDSLLYQPHFEADATVRNETRGIEVVATDASVSALNMKKGDDLVVHQHLQYSAPENAGIAYGTRLQVSLPENVTLTGTGTLYVNNEPYSIAAEDIQDGSVYLGRHFDPDAVRMTPEAAATACQGLVGQPLGVPPYTYAKQSPYYICYVNLLAEGAKDLASPWDWQILPGDDVCIDLNAKVLEDAVGSITAAVSYRNNYFEDDFSQYNAGSTLYYGHLDLQARAKNLPTMQNGDFYQPEGKFELVPGAKYALIRQVFGDNPPADHAAIDGTGDGAVDGAGEDAIDGTAADTDGIPVGEQDAAPAEGCTRYANEGINDFIARCLVDKDNTPEEVPELAINAIRVDGTLPTTPHSAECSNNEYARSHQPECIFHPYSPQADGQGYLTTDANGHLEVDYLEAGSYCVVEVDVPQPWKHTPDYQKCFAISDFRNDTEHLSASVAPEVDYEPVVGVKTEVRNLTRETTNGLEDIKGSDAEFKHDVVARPGDKLHLKYTIELPESRNASYLWNPKLLLKLADGYTTDENGNATEISEVPGFTCANLNSRWDTDLLEPEGGRRKMVPGAKTYEVDCEGVAEDTNAVFLANISAAYTKTSWQDVSIVYPSQASTRVVDDAGTPITDPNIRFELLDGGLLAGHEEGTPTADEQVGSEQDWKSIGNPEDIDMDSLTAGLKGSFDFSKSSYAKVDLSSNLHDQTLPYSPQLGEDGYLHPDANGDIGMYYLPEGSYVLHQVNTAPGYYYDDDARSFSVLDKSYVTSYHNVLVGGWAQHTLEPFSVLMALRTNPNDHYSTHTHVLHPEETADIVTDFALPAHLNPGSLEQLALYMHAPHFLEEAQFQGHYAALEKFARDNLKVIYYAEDSNARVTSDILLTENDDYTVTWLDEPGQAHDEDLLFSIEFSDALVQDLLDPRAHIALSYQIEGKELYREEQSFEVHERSVGEVNRKRSDSNDIGLYGNLTSDNPPAPAPEPEPVPSTPANPKLPRTHYTIEDDSAALDAALDTLSSELKKAHNDYGKSRTQAGADAQETAPVSDINLWLWSIFLLVLLLLLILYIVYRARIGNPIRKPGSNSKQIAGESGILEEDAYTSEE